MPSYSVRLTNHLGSDVLEFLCDRRMASRRLAALLAFQALLKLVLLGYWLNLREAFGASKNCLHLTQVNLEKQL
jgi:hypothetical protein